MLPALHVEKETETGRGRQCGTSGLQRALILAAQFRGRRWGRWPRYCPDPLPEAEDPPTKERKHQESPGFFKDRSASLAPGPGLWGQCPCCKGQKAWLGQAK